MINGVRVVSFGALLNWVVSYLPKPIKYKLPRWELQSIQDTINRAARLGTEQFRRDFQVENLRRRLDDRNRYAGELIDSAHFDLFEYL